MNNTHKANDKSCEAEDSVYPIASLAFVVNCRMDKMPIILEKVQDIDGVRIVYKRASAGRLTIVDSDR